MRFLRFRLRTLMIAILAVAVALGTSITLVKRRERFLRLSHEQSSIAGRLELEMVRKDKALSGKLPQAEAQAILDRVHWHDAMAARYQRAADRPWRPAPSEAVTPR